MSADIQEHPFAEYIRILGKGKRGSRPLTQSQAYDAMRLILADAVEPIQLGAFLMLMRIKEETPEELAGFVQAARDSLLTPTDVTIDLDWSSYAGKRRHLPWFILSALLLAGNGIKILMHGTSGHSANRVYTQDVLLLLDIEYASSMQQAQQQISDHNFSYLPLEFCCPKLHQIIELRPLLGLRSPVHTLVRLLNPCNADYSIQGIFHPGYRPVHQQASLLLKQPHMAVLKGEGGEIERNPDSPCLVQSVHNGELSDEEWPAFFKRRHLKPEQLNPNELVALWRGEHQDEYAEATIIGTTAVVLKLLEKSASQQQAESMAHNLWTERNKQKHAAIL
jgi:anthranilate phosphoribosyltransferase